MRLQGAGVIVRRTRLTDAWTRSWPDWRHFGFLTDLDGDTVTIDGFHRQHAVVELVISDLKEGAGMEHVPSGNFSANSAWLQCAVLAHNLIRWTATLGTDRHVDQLAVARTILSPSPAASSTWTEELAMGPMAHPPPRPAPHSPAHHQLNRRSRAGAPRTGDQR